MDSTDQLHFLAALSMGKEPRYPLKGRLGGAWSQSGWTGWGLEPVWMDWRRENSLSLARNETHKSAVQSLVIVLTVPLWLSHVHITVLSDGLQGASMSTGTSKRTSYSNATRLIPL
jgi:hypothetical protein